MPPPEIIQDFASRVRRHQLEEQARVARFGKVRPEIAVEFAGRTFVAVGNKLHYSEPNRKWRTFPDFLMDYAAHVFGKEWGDKELKKPLAERHPMIQWWSRIREDIRKRNSNSLEVSAYAPNNHIMAFNSFAHDLYTVEHNGRLDDFLLGRLRNRAEFEGARHELCAEATCHRAGYEIEHEDQRDSRTRHAEFVAVHKGSKQRIAVEAKRRRRLPDKEADFKFEGLINDAIGKNVGVPLAIFLDTNLPSEMAREFYGRREIGGVTRPSEAMESLLDTIRARHGGTDPYNIIVFTNHPYNLPSEEGSVATGFTFSSISTIPKENVDSLDALLELHRAATLYYNVPNKLPKSSDPES